MEIKEKDITKTDCLSGRKNKEIKVITATADPTD